jgi:hypothetical protein
MKCPSRACADGDCGATFPARYVRQIEYWMEIRQTGDFPPKSQRSPIDKINPITPMLPITPKKIDPHNPNERRKMLLHKSQNNCSKTIEFLHSTSLPPRSQTQVWERETLNPMITSTYETNHSTKIATFIKYALKKPFKIGKNHTKTIQNRKISLKIISKSFAIPSFFRQQITYPCKRPFFSVPWAYHWAKVVRYNAGNLAPETGIDPLVDGLVSG